MDAGKRSTPSRVPAMGFAETVRHGALVVDLDTADLERAFTGAAAATLADLPDRNTVNTMIVTAISGPARSIATVVSAVAGGLARCIQAKIDKGEGAA